MGCPGSDGNSAHGGQGGAGDETLHEEHRCESAAGDLIGDVPLRLLDTQRLQPFGQISIADMPALQLGLRQRPCNRRSHMAQCRYGHIRD